MHRYAGVLMRAVASLMLCWAAVPITITTAEDAVPPRIVLVALTGQLNIDLMIINNNAPITGPGGGIAVTPKGVAIARPLDRSMWFYDRGSDSMFRLGFALPETNWDQLPATTPGGRPINRDPLRYRGVGFVQREDGVHVLITFGHYDPVRVCFVSRLAQALLPPDWASPLAEGAVPVDLAWEIVLEGSPCLPFAEQRNAFGGNQMGGGIAVSPDGTVYFTTGDLEFDGLGSKQPAVSQLDGATYGRVFKILPNTWEVQELAKGLRNPQGIAIDAAGGLWTTDHGPMGGDELNHITGDQNLGWPNVTFGVNYTDPGSDQKFWPQNPIQGQHEGYDKPEFAWVPSVAPSSLALVSGFHPRWDGDLIMGTLAGQAIRRIKFDGDRVILDEAIPLNARVRDVAVGHGRIYVFFDDGRFGYATPHHMGEPD